VKIRVGWAGSINEALPPTEPPEYLAFYCAAAERGVMIKKNEKKESSSVKLKAFRHTCRAA